MITQTPSPRPEVAEASAATATAPQTHLPAVANNYPDASQNTLIRPGFSSAASFALLKQMAMIFANSHIVPTVFRANPNNALIACHMAQRMNCDPLTVMQNLHIINGRPGWSAQFLIAVWNGCGRFSPMRFEWITEGPQKGCRAYATELATGEKLVGTTITWKMVQGEGWEKKAGSKWATMPEQMFMYRAAAFMVRAFAPEITLGLHTADEMQDVHGNSSEPQEGVTQPSLNAVMPEAVVAEVKADAMPPAEETIDVAVESAQAVKPEVTATEQVTEVVSRPAEPAAVEPQAAVAVSTTVPTAIEKESQSPVVASMPAEAPQVTATEQENPPVDQQTLIRMAELCKRLAPPQDVWRKVVASFGVEKAKDLRQSDAGRVIAWLEAKLSAKELTAWATSAPQPVHQRNSSGGGASAEIAPFR